MILSPSYLLNPFSSRANANARFPAERNCENIKHKLNGFIVENRNSEELKDAIDWIIDNLNSNNNLRETVQIFDKKKIAMEYLNLYKKILNN